mgnify:CR=1 FL=1
MATVNLKARISSFHGQDWKAVRDWLEAEKEQRISKLIGATTQQDSDKQRGALQVIDKLLNAERDAG